MGQVIVRFLCGNNLAKAACALQCDDPSDRLLDQHPHGERAALRAAARAVAGREAPAYRTAIENANDSFYLAAPVSDRQGWIVDCLALRPTSHGVDTS
jgi:hypothetical protein